MNKALFLIDPSNNIFSYTLAYLPLEEVFIRIQLLNYYFENGENNTKNLVDTKWIICKQNLIFAKSNSEFVSEEFVKEFMAQQGDYDNSHKFTEEFTFVSAQEGIAFFNEFITTKLKKNDQAQEL